MIYTEMRMKKSETINELACALARAQGEMKNPPLDGENPHFKSRFASLAGVRDTVIPVLARHGLSVIQSPGSGAKGPTLTTLLMHSSGQWVECDALELPVSKQDAQGYGSALTYARRYSLLAVAGVTGDDDDDGNAAVQQQQQPRKAKPASSPTTKPDEPKDGKELRERLAALDAWAVSKGLCAAGAVRTAVLVEAKANRWPDDVTAWSPEQVRLGMAQARHVVKDMQEKKNKPAA